MEDPTPYDCEACRSFQDNLGGEPTEAQPFHDDCYIHQHVKRRCMIRMSTEDTIKRCELPYHHLSDCQPVGTATTVIRVAA